MKNLLPLLGAALLLNGSLRAQEPAVPPPEPMIAAAARFDASQLEQLLGPVALYPDALIALILPASTAPSDVVLAARYLRDGGNADQAELQPWDESVQALARYPDVVKWMDDNLAWTKQLGEAFTAQPAEVMNAVQRLRGRAQAAGTLVSTPQQQVIVQQATISIVPAQPDVIYIPYYDPEVVFVPRPAYYTTRVRFGSCYRSGFWLSYNLDWSARRVCVVDHDERERYWRERPDYWRRPYFSDQSSQFLPPNSAWTPRARPGYRENFTPRVPVSPRPPIVDNRPAWHGNNDTLDRADRRGPGDHRRNFNTPVAPVGPQPAPATTTNISTIPRLALANPLPQPLPTPLQNIPTPNVQPPAPRPPLGGSWARGNGYGNGELRREDRGDRRERADRGDRPPQYQGGFHAAPAPQPPANTTFPPRMQTANGQTHAPRSFVPPPPPAPAPVSAPIVSAPAVAPAPAPAQNPQDRPARSGDENDRNGRHRFER